METIGRGLGYVDLEFLGRQRVIATAILEGPQGVTLVDPGPSTCLATLRRALDGRGIALRDVTTVLLTHIHLDHAGACGSIVREQPGVAVYVHERGAPHLADPSKLLASATRLYGDDMDRLWGAFVAVPADNLRPLAGGERLAVGDRELEVAYTPGHASHHVSYIDRASGVAFVGDTAGIRTGSAPFVMPPTPPPDIDLDAWAASIETIRRWQPSTLFVTHWGAHEDPDTHLDALGQHLRAMAELARRVLENAALGDEESRAQAFVEEMRAYLARHLPPAEVALYDQAAPLAQCWLGLARYWRKRS